MREFLVLQFHTLTLPTILLGTWSLTPRMDEWTGSKHRPTASQHLQGEWHFQLQLFHYIINMFGSFLGHCNFYKYSKAFLVKLHSKHTCMTYLVFDLLWCNSINGTCIAIDKMWDIFYWVHVLDRRAYT